MNTYHHGLMWFLVSGMLLTVARNGVSQDYAVVYTQEDGQDGSFSVMSKAQYLDAREQARAEADLSERALDAARDEWNGAESERVRRERDTLDPRDPNYIEHVRRRRNNVVKRKPFPDVDAAAVPELRCVGIYPTADAANLRMAELNEALRKSESLALSADSSPDNSPLSSSAPVRLEAKMPSRISKSNYASSSAKKRSEKAGGKDDRFSAADIKRATQLYEKHLARLKSGVDDGSGAAGLKKPGYLSGESDSNINVRRIGGPITRDFKK